MLPQILQSLASKNIQSIIIEGGPNTLQRFIDLNLWDEARIFIAPVRLGDGKASPILAGDLRAEKQMGGDKLRVILNNSLSQTFP